VNSSGCPLSALGEAKAEGGLCHLGCASLRDSVAKKVLLGDGSIRHAELGAEVFREQADGFTIGVGIGLHEVFHGFDQQFLALNVALVADARSAAPLRVGDYREGK
jgi:hypothetical protein